MPFARNCLPRALAAAWLASVPLAAQAQASPPVAEFRAWARTHAVPVASDTAATCADVDRVNVMARGARVIALSEPFHDGHEPLAQRNRFIRCLVTRHGVTAVALETGLAQSKRLYDHVLGRTHETDSVLRASFTYDFGALPANGELLAWLRRHNAGRPPADRVRLYGIDLPGQLVGDASAAIAATIAYVDRVDPATGGRLREEFSGTIPLFNAQRYPMLPVAHQLAISRQVHDFTELLRRRRSQYTAASSREEYEWALRQAVNAEQDDAGLRMVPTEFMRLVAQMAIDSAMRYTDDRLTAALEVREAAMAENVAWVLEREGPRGRVVYFAHTNHQARQVRPVPGHPSFMDNPAGRYLHAILGPAVFTVGAAYGTASIPAQPWVTPPPDNQGMEALLGAVGLRRYLIDLRALPSAGILHDWFGREHPMRGGMVPMQFVLPRAYDALLYLDRITPAGAPP